MMGGNLWSFLRGEESVEARGGNVKGCLDPSLAGNQEEAGDESRGVLALLLSCSLLPLCSSLSPLPC